MKLLKSILLSLVLVVIGSSTVFADGTEEYRMDEIGVKVQVPDSLLAYTRTSGIEESVINALGYKGDYKEHLIEDMKEEDNYFIGFDTNVSYQVSIRSVESHSISYSMKTDTEIIQAVNEGLEGEISRYGGQIVYIEVFTENGRKYAVVDLTKDTEKSQVYAIVENGQAYYFYVSTFSGEINESHKALIKQIAGTAEFYEKVEVVETAASNTTVAETASPTNERGMGIIDAIIDIAKIIVVLFVLILLIIYLSTKITNAKNSNASRSRGKKGGKAINYGSRKDVVYQERLKRVMGVDEKPQPVEAPLPEADELEDL